MVSIKKLRSNFELRFRYNDKLFNFLKTIPKEQCQTKMNSIMLPNNTIKEDWYRLVNEAGLAKIISFCRDQGIKFHFDNITSQESADLVDRLLEHNQQAKEAIQLKQTGIDVSGVDYSFMKIEPYEYQKQAVAFFETTNGNAILGDQPGVGKSLEVNELISTLNGWVRMGDIKVGDEIFHHDGKTYPVIGVFPQGKLDSYKVTFNDDFTLECSLDHLWMVRDVNRRRRKKGWIVKTLKELIDNGLHYNKNEKRAKTNRQPILKWEIPIVQPIQYPEQNYKIHPYILGVLLGDGYISGNSICVSVPDNQYEIVENINELLPNNLKTRVNNHPACPQYYITQDYGNKFKKNPFKLEIDNFKLSVKSSKKFIPKKYLIGSIQQRIDLLCGLMDTDGSARNNRINFHSSSKELAENVAELVQSLGGQAIIKTYNREHQKKSTEWRVSIRIDICPFKLKEKKDQWWLRRRNYASRYIKSIEYVGKKHHQCISVNSPDNTFVAKNYIVTHNTLSAISYALKNKYKTLVIVPASLKLNWRAEILKFTNEKCYIFKFKPRKKDNIETFTKEESLLHIINYESLESYFDFNYSHKCNNYNCKWEGITEVKKYDKCPSCGRAKVVRSRSYHLITKQDKDGEVLNPNDYDLIVMDEAHYIKNPTAFRSQIIKKAFKESSKKILMTGTAIKNRPYEFFPLLNLIDSKEWSNAHNFGVRYCNAHQDKFGHWNYDGASNLEELYRRISPYFLRRLKKDILKFLPPKTYTTIPIELKSDAIKEYKKIENGVIDESKETDDKMTHLARIQKLKQFTTLYKAKQSIEFIKNIIEGDEKIVVFSQFISATELIYNEFKDVAVIFTGKHNMIEKQQAVDKFMNDQECKIFVGSIGAAGVGLTLTSANCLMFIDLPWEPASKIQAEDRIHRASQKADNVQIIKLICQNTIDVDIDKLITEKEQIISKVLDGEIIEQKNEFSIFEDLLKIILDKKNDNL